ncbi:hypothetical protein [Prosthecobacter sp.]|uniref:hypothetical protein n=1 Tax=Prosthecobacter sp. TaxID=1965333 RepID=UPI003782ED1A
MSFTYKSPGISPFEAQNKNFITPLTKEQAAQAQQEMGPPLRVRPRDNSTGNFATKQQIDPRTGRPMIVDDPTKPIFTDPLGMKTVGSSTRSLNNLGGATNMPNMAAPGAHFSFGMGSDTRNQRSIDGSLHRGPDPFGHQFGDPFAAAAAGFGDTAGTPFETPEDTAAQRKKAFGMKDGGMVTGPGTEKSDSVPAMLSKGEFVMPAEAVRFFGTQKLQKMILQSREDADEATEPHGKADMREDKAEGEMDDSGMMHFAAGGFVDPYADNPMAAALAEQRGRDERLAQIGARDYGGGNIAMANKYGTGFVVPQIQGLPDAPGRFNDMQGGTTTATPGQGLTPVPDIVPTGNPWAAPSLPDDPAARREHIQTVSNQMVNGAASRRQDDLDTRARAARFENFGPKMITVPTANPFPYGDHGGTERTGFMAPWEKDAANRAAAQEAMPNLPGLNRTQTRRFLQTPQGAEMSMRSREIQDKRRSATTWADVPNSDYQINELGNLIHKNTGKPATLSPEQITALNKAGHTVTQGPSGTSIKYAPQQSEKSQKAARGVIHEIPGPMIQDPMNPLKKIQGPPVSVLVDPVTGSYKPLSPEGGAAPAPQPVPNTPGWQGWLDSKLGPKK